MVSHRGTVLIYLSPCQLSGLWCHRDGAIFSELSLKKGPLKKTVPPYPSTTWASFRRIVYSESIYLYISISGMGLISQCQALSVISELTSLWIICDLWTNLCSELNVISELDLCDLWAKVKVYPYLLSEMSNSYRFQDPLICAKLIFYFSFLGSTLFRASLHIKYTSTSIFKVLAYSYTSFWCSSALLSKHHHHSESVSPLLNSHFWIATLRYLNIRHQLDVDFVYWIFVVDYVKYCIIQ